MIGTVMSERYRLERKLGSGGMSTVYLATDLTLEREVAIKVMHREISDQPDQLERFRREARSVAQLSHPNVVAVIDAGDDDGHPYIVFEYVEGQTLKQRIHSQELPLDEAAAYAIEIGRGLAAAHARRLVHRDIKPQNVLIDREGRAKVTDFGIARELERDGGLTATGRVLGTTDYVSPEQAMGRDVDARSDIYSLGIVLFEMLTGDVPFKAETLVGVAMKHVNEPIPAVSGYRSDVSAALETVIERSTSKDPDQRYTDVRSMLRDLEAALEVEVARAGGPHGEATTVLDSLPPQRRVLTQRPRAALALTTVLAAAAVALVALVVAGGQSQEADPEAPGETVLRPTSAQDFDPPPGDGVEHADRVGLAIDGIPTTAWTTETYASPIEEVKEGVGLIVDAGEAVSARAVRVVSEPAGWSAEIYGTADSPPQTLEEWGEPLGSFESMSTDQRVQLSALTPSRYYLVWITSMPPVDDGYRVEISEVELET